MHKRRGREDKVLTSAKCLRLSIHRGRTPKTRLVFSSKAEMLVAAKGRTKRRGRTLGLAAVLASIGRVAGLCRVRSSRSLGAGQRWRAYCGACELAAPWRFVSRGGVGARIAAIRETLLSAPPRANQAEGVFVRGLKQ